MAQNVRELVVWQKAVDLTVCIYALTRCFPKDEAFGLTSQMRRASLSIASNIAEGRGRLNNAEFRQVLGVAQGSVFELKTQIPVARRLEMGDRVTLDEADSLAQEVSKILTSVIEKLRPTRQRLTAESR